MRAFSSTFLKAWSSTMTFEVGSYPNGGYTNDPLDPGGETKWGISKRYHPNIDIKNLSEVAAMEIAWGEYWEPMKLEKVPAGVAIEMFDTAFNLGQKLAIEIAQQSLIVLGSAVTIDGTMGPETIGALNLRVQKGDAAVLLRTMNGFQFVAYMLGANSMDEIIQMIRGRLAHIQRNIRGWLRRAE